MFHRAAPIPSVARNLPALAFPIYRPFFQAAILLVLTLGATWGAYLLLRIAFNGSFRAVGLHEVNAHGHAQIFGWVGLFVMGFAYQVFPRFKQTTLAWPNLAVLSFWLMLIGLVVRSLSEAFAEAAASLIDLAAAGAVLEMVAAYLFLSNIFVTFRRSNQPLIPSDCFIFAALVWFLIQTVYDGVYTIATLRASEPEQLLSLVATWQGPLREIQIHGFALLMILGVSLRILSNGYGFPSLQSKLSLKLLFILNAALIGELAGLFLMRSASRDWALVWYASAWVMLGCIAIMVQKWQLFRPVVPTDRSLKFIRAGYAWLFISLGMIAFLPVYQFVVLPTFNPEAGAAQIGFSHAYYGAIRHAITVGFISMMILGVSAKVVPTINGLDLHLLSNLWGPFILLNLGCALRVLNQTLTDFTDLAFPLAGLSGCLEVTALAWWGGHLFRIMFGWIKNPEECPTEKVKITLQMIQA